LRSALALALIATLLAGCASMSRKFTFLRPGVTRKEFVRTAPEYSVEPDSGRSDALMALDRIALAEQRLRDGRFDEAEEEAKAALELDPTSADAYTILAVAAAQRDQDEQAGGYYAKAVELAPERGSVLNNYGVWLCA